jgi:hypothetical protein
MRRLGGFPKSGGKWCSQPGSCAVSGGGGIRTHEGGCTPFRFSRQDGFGSTTPIAGCLRPGCAPMKRSGSTGPARDHQARVPMSADDRRGASVESPATESAMRPVIPLGTAFSRRLVARTLLHVFITGRPSCCATHSLSTVPSSIASMRPWRSSGDSCLCRPRRPWPARSQTAPAEGPRRPSSEWRR